MSCNIFPEEVNKTNFRTTRLFSLQIPRTTVYRVSKGRKTLHKANTYPDIREVTKLLAYLIL